MLTKTSHSQTQTPSRTARHAIHFEGCDAVAKRLRSARMQVVRVTMWRGCLGSVWEADVVKNGNAEQRWVRRNANGWQILKAPPGEGKASA
jgi:hypothetical protein